MPLRTQHPDLDFTKPPRRAITARLPNVSNAITGACVRQTPLKTISDYCANRYTQGAFRWWVIAHPKNFIHSASQRLLAPSPSKRNTRMYGDGAHCALCLTQCAPRSTSHRIAHRAPTLRPPTPLYARPPPPNPTISGESASQSHRMYFSRNLSTIY